MTYECDLSVLAMPKFGFPDGNHIQYVLVQLTLTNSMRKYVIFMCTFNYIIKKVIKEEQTN